MTDGSGKVVWAADYKPFGEASLTVSTITNNLRFPGQYYDQETNLHYNYRRDYNPGLDRYIEADPIGIDDGANHLFVYVANNPIRYTDSDGLKVQRCKRPLAGFKKIHGKLYHEFILLNDTDYGFFCGGGGSVPSLERVK